MQTKVNAIVARIRGLCCVIQIGLSSRSSIFFANCLLMCLDTRMKPFLLLSKSFFESSFKSIGAKTIEVFRPPKIYPSSPRNGLMLCCVCLPPTHAYLHELSRRCRVRQASVGLCFMILEVFLATHISRMRIDHIHSLIRQQGTFRTIR